jgi:hypothetical protein
LGRTNPIRKVKKMTFDEAKEILKKSHKCSLHDSSFGDTEMGWYETIDIPAGCEVRKLVADGYSSNMGHSVKMNDRTRFTGDEARELMSYFATIKAESNN